ncbi:uncharacterized protein V1513DRAFT_476590 [Lipomyces chichibuensis]|uniref:uncharacterized protein n=1 Tax=Lipomyces chichibuensis TaxID=1546026 RepID=UPI003343E438
MSARGSTLHHKATSVSIRGLRYFQPSLHSPCIASRKYLFSSTALQTASQPPTANGTSGATAVSERSPWALSKEKKKNPKRSSPRKENCGKPKVDTSRVMIKPIIRRSPNLSDTRRQSKLEFKIHSEEDAKQAHTKHMGRVTTKPWSKSDTRSSGKPNTRDNLTFETKGSRTQKKKQVTRKWDPYVLAEKTKKALEKGKLTDAVTLARDGRDRSTVSWNYIIQYEFQNKHVSAALGYFNEMRKRGAAPNDRTFTMVLNGLAINADTAATAVQKCLRIFAYITDQKRVKVNNFHLNSALKVCASASDVDAMWQVLEMADNLVEPDEATYTTIAPLLAKEGTSIDDVFPKGNLKHRSFSEEVGFRRLRRDSQEKHEFPADETHDNNSADGRGSRRNYIRDEKPRKGHESSSRVTNPDRATTSYTDEEIDRKSFLRIEDGRESARDSARPRRRFRIR